MEKELKNGGEMGPAENQPHFRPKKGSIFPAKRRSVKRMMFDYIVSSLASIPRRRRRPSPGEALHSAVDGGDDSDLPGPKTMSRSSKLNKIFPTLPTLR